ncbi:MAG: AI-2E family transporter [Patescibacteria group bacterium]|nr:AI-2E family transporter [Patescibacteria group bacterium]
MNKQNLQFYFSLIIFVGTIVLSFFIFKPFLYTLILATILGVIFLPIYRRILKWTKNRKNLSSLITILIILVFIFLPLIFLGIQIVNESSQLYFYLANADVSNLGNNFFLKINNLLPEQFQNTFDLNFANKDWLNQYVRQGLGWLMQNVGTIFSNLAKGFLNLFIFVVALFFIFKDSEKIKQRILEISPFANVESSTVLRKLKSAINSVVRGNLLIALIQGALTSIGFLIFGVPNAVLWGAIAVLASLIPTIGTGLIIIPAVIYLFLNGTLVMTIGLLIWGFVVVGLIDNLLRPILIEKGIELNLLVILLSVLGGLILFGPIGFLLGPLVISFLFTLIEIYLTKKE